MSQSDTEPAWSPFGDEIVYVADNNIAVMDTNPAVSENDRRTIDTNSADDKQPDWQPIPQCTINGTPEYDTGKNTINVYGQDGSDFMYGGNHDDTMYGQADGDYLYGQADNDTLYGGPGNDTVVGGADIPTDALRGDDGDDVVKARPDSSATSGGGVDPNGNDMSGGAGNDKIFGSDGSDTIELLSDFPRSGNDRINTRDGEVDRVDCGAGEDDRLTADHIDIVLGGCETVFLPPPS